MNICQFAEFSFVKRTTTILFLFLSYIFVKLIKISIEK
jgi:hypothetical protein